MTATESTRPSAEEPVPSSRRPASESLGQRYGRLTVTKIGANTQTTDTVAVCDCGEVWIGGLCTLRIGNTRSCGCLARELAVERMTTHGESSTPLFRVWMGILDRCRHHPSYGGRGVGVCPEWAESYTVFRDWALANGWSKGMHVDRIDGGDYEPSNCQILTEEEHRAKTARELRALTDEQIAEAQARYAEGGITKAALARAYGVSKPTMGTWLARDVRA